ncbi:MAG: carbon-nitrogen hydrolase family protein [Fimbriimonadaceae bacterium]|nr:carbon-nitrogen hydrolase family protein [Fimbriimonadaceae bacterium]
MSVWHKCAWIGLWLGGIALSAALLVLALPPSGFGFLGWICWVPAMVGCHRRGVAIGFVTGIGVCLIAAALAATGLPYAERRDEGDPGWIYVGFAIFGLVAGFLLAVIASAKGPINWQRGLVWAAWAVLAEAALLIYLPAHLALTQWNNGFALIVASLGGIWMVSFLVWAVNIFLAEVLTERRYGLAAAVALPFLVFQPLSTLIPPETGPLPIAMIQTEAADEQALSALNRKAGELGAELAVWPELSGMGLAPGGKTDALVKLATQPGQPPFVTSYPDASRPKPFNTASVFSVTGESGRYRKRKPFAAEQAIHQAGDQAVAVEALGARAGLNICFDTCFPNVMRDTARLPDVNLILLTTLDPPTPHGVIQAIHASYTPFRSAELGVPIIRAEATAWSMATDHRGLVIARLGLEKDSILIAKVSPQSRKPVALYVGDGFLLVCAGLAVWGMISRFRVPHPPTPSPSEWRGGAG